MRRQKSTKTHQTHRQPVMEVRMPDRDTIKLSTLTDLEREVRRQYGRSAEAMLAGLPLDYSKRVASLRRMLHLDPTELGDGRAKR
jgi:hypothetical protein